MSLDPNRHSAARYAPGQVVYDEVTRQQVTVIGTEIRSRLVPKPGAAADAPLASVFDVPAVEHPHEVSVRSFSGEVFVRDPSQLHPLPEQPTVPLTHLAMKYPE